MIDDATLAKWEQRKHRSVAFIFDSSGNDLPDFVGIPTEDYKFFLATLKDATTEIRRLREAVPTVVIEPQCFKTGCEADIWRVRQKKWEADLAAHRAVVRELATELKRYVGDLGLPILAHPLVQQAREEKK